MESKFEADSEAVNKQLSASMVDIRFLSSRLNFTHTQISGLIFQLEKSLKPHSPTEISFNTAGTT